MSDHSKAIDKIYKLAKKFKGKRVPMSQVGEKWDWKEFNEAHKETRHGHN